MFELSSSLIALLALMGAMTVLWVLSRRLEDVSIIDPFWPAAFVVLGGTYASVGEGPLTGRGALVLGMLGLWTLRLGGYLLWRWFGHSEEDHRYAAMRAGRGESFRTSSLWIIFWFQAFLAWVVAAPVFASLEARTELGALAWGGVGLYGLGMFFEAVSDLQLARFKSDPANRGKVLDQGLWALSRHPNYFGNFCIWWGLWLVALDAGGLAWASVYGPLFMTLLLFKVSGVALLEKDIGERRPAYADYVRRTNAFFPGPKRRA
jgi:steroid 5-alpha reductase family enzyme